MISNSFRERGWEFVPVKTIKERDRLPWVSNTIWIMIRRINTAYRKLRDSKSKEDTNVFYDLKRTVQREIRKLQ